MCASDYFDYSNLFIKQFIQTLAQLSAVIVSTTVAVPVYSYYVRFLSNTKGTKCTVNENDFTNKTETEGYENQVEEEFETEVTEDEEDEEDESQDES